MGNCFTCFKEPTPTAQETQSAHCHKEEMPDDRLFQTAHISAATASLETSLISNGNHLSSAPESATIAVATATSVNRFYPYQRRAQSKSAPVMGLTDSRPSDAKLNALFETYRDSDEDAICEEGIERLCNDLQVSPEDFKVLVLAWKLGAEQMCRFTRQEFVAGLRRIRADSVRTLQSRLPELVGEVESDDDAFKNLYRFTFRFGLDSAAGQRILPIDMAVVLWRLVFTVREPPVLDRWLNFLKKHEQYRGIPKDTWNMFLNFSETVGNDLSSYDDNEAWPSLFDDFVEYENDQANQNVTRDKERESLIITKDD